MSAAAGTSCVRPLMEEDVPQIADLHWRMFGTAARPASEVLDSYRAYFADVFLNSAFRSEGAGSLVYEQGGKVQGFLGVMPRPMCLNGRAIAASVSSNFVVEPAARGLAGVKLMHAFLNGPHDLCLADEANPASRDLWQGLGGSVSHLHSIRWIYPLRPSRFGLLFLRKAVRAGSWLSAAADPLARTLDAVASRAGLNPFHPAPPAFHGEEMDSEALRACLAGCNGKDLLRPDYDSESMQWVLRRARERRNRGRLRSVLVRTEAGEIAGWYVSYIRDRYISDVLQLCAKPRHLPGVFDHLAHAAAAGGAVALRGRLEPALMQVLSDRNCPMQSGPQWVLLHSRWPELVNAFRHGALFSRLDGEWCFHLE